MFALHDGVQKKFETLFLSEKSKINVQEIVKEYLIKIYTNVVWAVSVIAQRHEGNNCGINMAEINAEKWIAHLGFEFYYSFTMHG